MYRPGLVSVTFRQLDPAGIIALCLECGLEGIEWGGDIHVPPGDLKRASEVARLTRDNGLESPTYGSYYRLGEREEDAPDFPAILETAGALGAPAIRVWAGRKGWLDSDEADRNRVLDDLRECSQLAAEAGRQIVLEYHAKTLTDHPGGAAFLLENTSAETVKTLWQPPNGMETEAALDTLLQVRYRLAHLHVFHWWPTNKERHPLADGTERWTPFLMAARPAPEEGTRWCLLEFVLANEPAQLKADAATLKAWIARAGDG